MACPSDPWKAMFQFRLYVWPASTSPPTTKLNPPPPRCHNINTPLPVSIERFKCLTKCTESCTSSARKYRIAACFILFFYLGHSSHSYRPNLIVTVVVLLILQLLFLVLLVLRESTQSLTPNWVRLVKTWKWEPRPRGPSHGLQGLGAESSGFFLTH